MSAENKLNELHNPAGSIAKPFGTGISAEKIAPGLTFLLALATGVVGSYAFVSNALDGFHTPLLALLCFAAQVVMFDVYRTKGRWDLRLAGISGLCFALLLSLRAMPEFITGWQFNVVIDRALLAGIFLLAVSVPTMSLSTFYFFGATPRADDLSRYPWILTPILLAFAVYSSLVFQLFIKGLANLSVEALITPYFNFSVLVRTFIAGDWPAWTTERRFTTGLLHYIQGTGLLMLVTSLISLPVGVGVGVYLSEYGDNLFGKFTRFVVTSLRSMSLLILGMTALYLAQSFTNTPLDWVFKGSFFSGIKIEIGTGGSFLTASIVMSLLVIPIIARSTEEGCKSLPNELREGSFALGASEERTLWKIILPWALPNMITALLLGCAEVAGCMEILLFIGSTGDFGVGLFKPVTSLAYFIFDVKDGNELFRGSMRQYQYTAGVLLMIITLSLGLVAMAIKKQLHQRHRGA